MQIGDKFYLNNQIENLKLRMIIEHLKMREKQVIAHEMAHKAVGGQYTGAVHYTYTRGPDGRYYITGGEVSIDVSPEADPEKTIRKMQIVRAAALAPSDPSPQDIAVAQRATAIEIKARLELILRKYKENEENKLSHPLRTLNLKV
ncbi:MAG: putative metalloprotease CJM1_0395 family protein [Caldimicrobium sp.]